MNSWSYAEQSVSPSRESRPPAFLIGRSCWPALPPCCSSSGIVFASAVPRCHRRRSTTWASSWPPRLRPGSASSQPGSEIGQGLGLIAAAMRSRGGSGEAVWTYYDLIRGVQVPFPSLADLGFLLGGAVPVRRPRALPGLLAARVSTGWKGCWTAPSSPSRIFCFGELGDLIGPMYRSQSRRQRSLKDVLSLAYPSSDVFMLSLVIILIAARAGTRAS